MDSSRRCTLESGSAVSVSLHGASILSLDGRGRHIGRQHIAAFAHIRARITTAVASDARTSLQTTRITWQSFWDKHGYILCKFCARHGRAAGCQAVSLDPSTA